MRRVTRLTIGKSYFVSTKEAYSPVNENGGTYLWGDGTDKVPVQCLSEYKQFYLCEVLPHVNRIHAFGPSHPYKITIEKWELSAEIFKAWEEGDEDETSDAVLYDYPVSTQAD